MIAHEDRHKVGRLVPTGLARHLVVYVAAIDFESLEGDVLHLALFVVAVDHRHVGLLTIVAYVAEGDILYPPTRGSAVLGIVAHLHVE